MKKIIAFIVALVLLVPAYADAANKALEKARNKELKTKLKEYKKGKWEILGSRTLEFSLAKHYDRLNELGDDGHEVEGISTRTKSKNTGKQMAINNAAITYAQEAGSSLQGRVVADMKPTGPTPPASSTISTPPMSASWRRRSATSWSLHIRSSAPIPTARSRSALISSWPRAQRPRPASARSRAL